MTLAVTFAPCPTRQAQITAEWICECMVRKFLHVCILQKYVRLHLSLDVYAYCSFFVPSVSGSNHQPRSVQCNCYHRGESSAQL